MARDVAAALLIARNAAISAVPASATLALAVANAAIGIDAR